MFKRYYLIIKKFFSLKAYNKVQLVALFLVEIARTLSYLLIPLMASKVVSYVTVNDYKIATIYIILFLLSGLFYVIVHHYNYVLYSKVNIDIHNRLQHMIMNKVTTYDEDFTKDMSTSYLVNTAFSDVGNVNKIPDQIFTVIAEVIGIFVASVILFKVNFIIGLVALILSFISIICFTYAMKKRDYYLTCQRHDQDDIANLLGQVLEGNKEIKAFNMKDNIKEYLNEHKRKWKSDYLKKRKYNDVTFVWFISILGYGKIFVYLILISLILQGKFEVATLVLVVGYYDNIKSKVEKLYKKLDAISGNSTRVDRIYKVLNYKTKNMLEFGNNIKDDIHGKIEFKNVSFIYEKNKVMDDVSFTIQPKSFIAIVGKSGSGKSTIFRLLLRLYKANKGNIYLDDINIYNYSKDVYANNVSIVTQKPFIFDMSIRENLNLIDSNIEHQIEACKKVGIHDFILTLKDGYNTKLIDNAENISTGQKQLLALARTLLSKSEVLLFDEVTSTLDMNTSKEIMKILKHLRKEHTILMITHKPTLMKLADEIIVIDNGKLVGRGNHKDLLETNKYYQTLQK